MRRLARSHRAMWVALALLLAPIRAVLAHSFEPALLDIREREPGVFEARWKSPGPESGSLTLGAADLAPRFPEQCHVVTTEPAAWRIDCRPTGLGGQVIAVDGIEGSRIDVILRLVWHDGETVTGALHSGAPSFRVPGGPASTGIAGGAVFLSYLRLGTEHILFGFDHLLFVLGLMLLVDNWRMLLKTISAFTVAHSVTLAAAVLGLVHVAPAPVEALIAMSIVLLALELTRPVHAPPTLARRYPWLVAFVFGLLHGLGFAGALVEVGIPADRIALALLSFNLGVELGQLAFVLVMLVPLLLMRAAVRRWPAIRLVPAYTIGSLAMAWTFERVQRFWL